MAYDYKTEMFHDIEDYIESEYGDTLPNREELEEALNDALWTQDSVTGNGSGSYTFSRAKAAEYVSEGGSEHLYEAEREGFITTEQIGQYVIDSNWEALDVCIRCYLLGQMIAEVLDAMERDGKLVAE